MWGSRCCGIGVSAAARDGMHDILHSCRGNDCGERVSVDDKIGYISRCPLCSHSLVCSENNSYFIGMKPLLKKYLIGIF